MKLIFKKVKFVAEIPVLELYFPGTLEHGITRNKNNSK